MKNDTATLKKTNYTKYFACFLKRILKTPQLKLSRDSQYRIYDEE